MADLFVSLELFQLDDAVYSTPPALFTLLNAYAGCASGTLAAAATTATTPAAVAVLVYLGQALEKCLFIGSCNGSIVRFDEAGRITDERSACFGIAAQILADHSQSHFGKQ